MRRSPRQDRAARLAGSIVATLGVVAGCTGAHPGRGTSPSPSPGVLSTTQLASGAAHDCVVGTGHPEIAWGALKNPILSSPNAGEKDEAIVWDDGLWHMLFSDVIDDRALPGGVRWQIATATSRDLARWSKPKPWPAQRGTVGVASPDIIRDPAGGFVVTFQSNPPAGVGTQDKLFYRTSSDLTHWSPPHPLAPAPGDRQIDAALAFTGHGVILGYKAGTATMQHFQVAWSRSGSLDGPWQLIGRPDISVNGDTIENYEFLVVDGSWHLVATSNQLDRPWIFTLAGSPADPTSWLHWRRGRELVVPSESWNSGPGLTGVGFEHANSAFLCRVGGYDYLFYAGSSELTTFGGWGHAEIGIARSRDLVHWQVPTPR